MKSLLFKLLVLGGFAPIAFADAPAAGAAHGGGMSSLVMIGAMFVAMYFMLIRPQSKKAKEHRNLIAGLAKGDEVVTQGGMLGKIERDAGSFFILSLADNVEVPVQKHAVVQLLPKGTIKSI